MRRLTSSPRFVGSHTGLTTLRRGVPLRGKELLVPYRVDELRTTVGFDASESEIRRSVHERSGSLFVESFEKLRNKGVSFAFNSNEVLTESTSPA